ncbi:uncharacterized protein ACA1_166450 [Acanthamoeba castellanii str. Neff]|uniref:Uncharacterized protein n=1 Tax=Acanthamoeba castellanii (strain ATCC 30010 / Neff) TaxID=1257118 RepID=L8H0N9_ACACF|nr:uncharacterized protein ACA1_166450 [Acanthamoeba castellanii str. Neff]ELR18787.1 hypothetical protein ACA1_166450 [Acanthamoeba castellanii str. Neff]
MWALFYNCFSICMLHIEHLGLLKRHLQYTCIANRIEEDINNVFKAFPLFPGKQTFTNQTQIGKLVVAGLTGGEMDSFLQVTELLFREWVSDLQEHECWHVHVDIVHLLQQDSFSANDLDKLEKLTKRWKHLMVKLYGSVAEWQCVMSLKKKWLKKCLWTAEMVASDMTMSGEKPLSFSFLNFEVMQHWPELICFLGPPWVQDTCLWEQWHLVAKMTVCCTNQINTEWVILIKEPYTLTVSVTAVADITSNCKCNLNDAVEQEVGEGSEIAYNHITSHNSAYYYGHFL